MNWISEFVDLKGLNLDKLIERFTLSTAEVEDIFHKGDDIKNVVVARILSVENHPKSKKLHLLKVDAGDKVYDCVCGAPNVREGLLVAFAREGGMVCGTPISRAVVGGYESFGMCCSEQELGISADHSGLMELTTDAPLGTDILELYDIRDTVFEVDNKSLTNRPDLWGHYGIAREFSALSGRPLRSVPIASAKPYKDLPKVEIDIKDKTNCYRYTSVKVENITRAVSPVNMRIRLFYCGTRAINLLADLTNYVMLELGQPMHAFDLRRVQKVEIQRFPEPFEFTTLDNVKRPIDPDTLMITSGDKPVCIAGIMGGLDSEIEDDTTSLLLESACFDAPCVRKSSARIGLRTDASMRYEKSLDPENTMTAALRYLYLLTQLDPEARVISAVTDSYAKKYKKIKLEFDKKYVDRYTGIRISNSRIVKTLESLGFTVKCEKNAFTVGVPSWRSTKDVTIKADIIEEITRIYGYDNFEIKTTLSPLYPVRPSQSRTDDYAIKSLLADAFGMHEVHSYIWCDAKKYSELGIEVEPNVHLINSISPDNIVIRNSLIPTLLSIASENKSFSPSFGIFEIGRVVEGYKDDGLCNERKKLGILLYSKTETEKALYLRIKDILGAIGLVIKGQSFELRFAESAAHKWQHPVNSADIYIGGKACGFMSCIYPTVAASVDKKCALAACELDMDIVSSLPGISSVYTDPSRFPGIDYDLSLMLDKDVPFSTASEVFEGSACPILAGFSVVDVYETPEMAGKRSVTVRLTFTSPERTLSGEEVQKEVSALLEKLESKGIKLK